MNKPAALTAPRFGRSLVSQACSSLASHTLKLLSCEYITSPLPMCDTPKCGRSHLGAVLTSGWSLVSQVCLSTRQTCTAGGSWFCWCSKKCGRSHTTCFGCLLLWLLSVSSPPSKMHVGKSLPRQRTCLSENECPVEFIMRILHEGPTDLKRPSHSSIRS